MGHAAGLRAQHRTTPRAGAARALSGGRRAGVRRGEGASHRCTADPFMSPGQTALIALDWGTSSARAYSMDADGAVEDQRSAPLGILQVHGGAFAAALSTLLGDWATLPVP